MVYKSHNTVAHPKFERTKKQYNDLKNDLSLNLEAIRLIKPRILNALQHVDLI